MTGEDRDLPTDCARVTTSASLYLPEKQRKYIFSGLLQTARKDIYTHKHTHT